MRSFVGSKRKFRAVAALAAAAIASIGLAGCSGGGSESSSGGVVTLNWWGWTPDTNVGEAYIKAFEKTHPKIKVNFKKIQIGDYVTALRPALSSSSGPDLFNLEPSEKFTQFQRFGIDLTPAVKKALGSDWKSKLAPIGVAGAGGMTNDKGELKGLSAGSGFAGSVWINQDLFEKYNLKPPTDFDQWVDVCKQFETHKIDCFVQGVQQTGFDQDTLQAISDTINPGLFSKATVGDAKWTDPDLVKAFTAWQDMFSNGIMQKGALGTAQYPDANNDFMSQKAAMVMMGTWYRQYTTVPGMTAAMKGAGVSDPTPFTMMPIPFPSAVSGGEPGAFFGAADYGLAVNAKSKNKDAATTFALWLGTSKEAQQLVANLLNDIPALKGVAPEWDKIELVNPAAQKPALEKMAADSTKVTENRLLKNVDLGEAIGDAATTLAGGKVTPKQAAETLQKAAEKAGVKFN